MHDSAPPPHRSQPKEAARERRTEQRAASRRQAAARREILAPVRPMLLGAGALTLVASLLTIVPVVLIVESARIMLSSPAEIPFDRIWPLLLGAIGALGLRALLNSVALGWSHLRDVRFQTEVRHSLADTLTRVPLGWFTLQNSGRIKRILQDDITAIHYLVAHAQLELVAAITTPLVTIGYLFVLDWRLALVLLLPLGAYSIVLSRMMGGEYSEKYQEYLAWEVRLQEATIEYLDGIKEVKTFGTAGRAHETYRVATSGFRTFFNEWSRPMTKTESASSILLHPAFVMLLVLVTGVLFIQSGSLVPLTLLPFVLLGLGLGQTVLTVGYGAQALRAASAAIERLHAVRQTPELVSAAHPVPASGLSGVAFHEVTFGYDRDTVVLDGVSLELDPGSITALVGASGSGKSTLAKLIPRFHDVDSGSISVGGVDIRKLALQELYRQVGFVFQDVHLLRASVRDNLRLAKPDATDEELAAAAAAAQILDRIEHGERGWDAVIGVDVTFSGGEAQRLSIARAILADAPVLILDEATAYADPESEALIQRAIGNLMVGKTVLVIAHRLHTITEVDSIVVLRAGRIVERGSHEKLLAAAGEYAALWQANEHAVQQLTAAPPLSTDSRVTL